MYTGTTKEEKRINRLAVIIGILSVVATMGGLLIPGLYQDGPWYNAQWYGQDMITLVVAVPILLVATGLKQRHPKAGIAVAGALAYLVYTYSFYGFVAAFNDLYLLHIAILSLSFFTLVFQLHELRPLNFGMAFRRKGWIRTGAVYLLLMAIMLTVIWGKEIVSHLFIEGYRSDLPGGEAPTIVFTLDLGFVIPLAVYSAVNAWRGRYWGTLLLGLTLLMSTVMGLALMGMAFSLVLSELAVSYDLALLWSVIGIIGLILSLQYLRAIELYRIDNSTQGEKTTKQEQTAQERG